jgi:hypothetical protein
MSAFHAAWQALRRHERQHSTVDLRGQQFGAVNANASHWHFQLAAHASAQLSSRHRDRFAPAREQALR